ncbi:uncharacterized protein LOC104897395 isoform X1 [Beta vulgaris subsp. vulgaris]|uniref:uncharacterized protein LOC104897395 isoform X1 n=1 Tax=Beta vulgaris subsp. vulgaris TaxID=3555 RepID=UPI002037421F|nr:uncharacterized protein LOC104897395 isoform X1 [Beta vulgaris subsp. vulgaris]
MGDIIADEALQLYNRDSSDCRRHCKNVKDNVHGLILLDPLALKFIDTEQFQRLRDLKQLGVTHLVFPGAVHSRFEHSLGVYHLAGAAVNELKRYQGSELGIETFDMQAVKLAGLLHDVGHGPFSHMFESGFLPKVLGGAKWSHEDMSYRLVDYIVDEHNIEMDDGMLKKVKEMIVASTEHGSADQSVKEKRFLYDIVANGRNSIDVDKFDYIVRDSRACGLGCSFEFERLFQTMRVMDDEICYRAKEYLTISKMFNTRADLHRTVYTHSKVKAIELMVVDALLKANNHLQITSKIHDPAEFWKLDDTIIKRIEIDPHPALKESRDLISRIRRRDLYQFCNEFTVPRDELEHFRDITAKDIICSQVSGGVTLQEDDVVVSNTKIDLTRGKINPLGSIKFFQDYDSDKSFTIGDGSISQLLPSCCLDRIVKVYAKKPELVAAVSDAFENFQEQKYGRKTQVHGTPQKKKQRKL